MSTADPVSTARTQARRVVADVVASIEKNRDVRTPPGEYADALTAALDEHMPYPKEPK